jgi:aminopeptidase
MLFTKKQIEKYADVMLNALQRQRPKGKFKPYETVMMRYNTGALELVEAIHRKLVTKKINIVLRSGNGAQIEKDFYSLADNRQIKFTPPGTKELYNNLHGYIAVISPPSLTHLKAINSKKFAIAALAHKPFKDIMHKREDSGHFSWTLCCYPSKAMSKAAGISEKKFTAQIIKACFLNQPSPVKKWETVYKKSEQIRKWLNSLSIDTLHIKSKSVNLKVKIGEKRKFVSSLGSNVPSFEIFTSPDYRYTQGTFFADVPLYRTGNLIKKIKLKFENGMVKTATVAANGKFLSKILKTDKGAARLGEIALVDKRFSKIDRFMANTLFDENYGGKYGSLHIALGSSFSDTYKYGAKKLTKVLKKNLGFNDSAIHIDIINTENKTVTATLKNGKKVIIYKNGRFSFK